MTFTLLTQKCGFLRKNIERVLTMQRSGCFGIGITLMLVGLALFYTVHSMDPGDNTPIALIIGVALFCPGAVLLGRAIWPPTEK
jgi:hypothetical protein